jgi:tRNA(Ile)-lysidine synthase
LILVPRFTDGQENEFFWEENTRQLHFPAGTLRALEPDIANQETRSTPTDMYLPLHRLRFPLVVRRWRAGDRFCPTGLQGRSQKVSDWLVNAKIPLPEKERVWVLVSGNEICWIIGYRGDDRYVCHGRETACLRLSFSR